MEKGYGDVDNWKKRLNDIHESETSHRRKSVVTEKDVLVDDTKSSTGSTTTLIRGTPSIFGKSGVARTLKHLKAINVKDIENKGSRRPKPAPPTPSYARPTTSMNKKLEKERSSLDLQMKRTATNLGPKPDRPVLIPKPTLPAANPESSTLPDKNPLQTMPTLQRSRSMERTKPDMTKPKSVTNLTRSKSNIRSKGEKILPTAVANYFERSTINIGSKKVNNSVNKSDSVRQKLDSGKEIGEKSSYNVTENGGHVLTSEIPKREQMMDIIMQNGIPGMDALSKNGNPPLTKHNGGHRSSEGKLQNGEPKFIRSLTYVAPTTEQSTNGEKTLERPKSSNTSSSFFNRSKSVPSPNVGRSNTTIGSSPSMRESSERPVLGSAKPYRKTVLNRVGSAVDNAELPSTRRARKDIPRRALRADTVILSSDNIGKDKGPPMYNLPDEFSIGPSTFDHVTSYQQPQFASQSPIHEIATPSPEVPDVPTMNHVAPITNVLPEEFSVNHAKFSAERPIVKIGTPKPQSRTPNQSQLKVPAASRKSWR
ncbi:uncharacterized protein LOC127851873 [Dreissena polymorpha]|uniref:Uncharacterized protein n=1 Tax=Dreissena polymorpha TaxID=45954 RepID=A0A9D4DB34_DREPO|nr:uncharacterized protein LOC127851873 [Dreissena polymorpha]KAH3742303.1 hypothetical protein DPMN_049042 [Dreissena polymorpha]